MQRLCVLLWLAATAGHCAALQVVDDLGTIVNLPRPAERIISLAPHITETLFAVGAGQQLVAAVTHSDYPKAAVQLPRVGTYTNINIERLLAFQPDLVIAWQSGNGNRLIKRLRALAVPLYVTNPKAPEDIAANLLNFGILSGHPFAAKQASTAFSQKLRELRNKYAHRRPVSVFYQVWNNPLITINGEHLISRLINLCGGRNVFAALPMLAPRVSLESVLATDPAVIVASGTGGGRPAWLNEWTRWPQLSAVSQQQLFYIPPEHLQRHAPRILEGAELLCKQFQQARHNSAASR